MIDDKSVFPISAVRDGLPDGLSRPSRLTVTLKLHSRSIASFRVRFAPTDPTTQPRTACYPRTLVTMERIHG